MRDPLLLPLLSLSSGIAASRLVGFDRFELALALAGFVVLAVIGRRGSVWLSNSCVMLAFAALGALAHELHRPGPPPQLDAEPGEIVVLSGCVVEPSVFSDGRERFVLELAPEARVRVSIFPREGEVPPSLAYGQQVELEARVRSPRNYENPGAFDATGYLARRHIYWTASVPVGSTIQVLPGRCGSRWQAALFNLRARALERIETLYTGDGYATAMMQAVLLGESSKLEKVWTDHFRRTGTYHALVISGLHVTVLAAVLLFLLRLAMLSEVAALTLAVMAAWLYALITGAQPPVTRAAGGFTLFLVARFFYRERRVLNLLAAVAMVVLLYDPAQMFEASFQLSFLSVAAIGALAMPLIERTSGPLARGLGGLADPQRDPRLEPRVAQFRIELRLIAETMALWTRIPERWWLFVKTGVLRVVFYGFELMAISAAIQVGLALPMVFYFHRVSFTGLTANLMVTPAMTAVVPLGFSAVFTGWSVLATIAGSLMKFSAWVAELHAGWEPAWRVPDPPLWLAAAFTLSLIGVALPGRWRKVAAVFLCALFAVLVLHPFAPQTDRAKLELTVLDVGQGDSLLVALPEGKLVLMDAGGFPVFGRRSKPRIDIGEDVVSPYLWSRSIRRLDAVALSHAHEDHAGGLAAVIRNFRPAELWVGAVPDCPAWQEVDRAAAQARTRIRRFTTGDEFDYGGVQIETLSPPADYQPRARPGNDDSLVLKLTFGSHSFLLTGDVERRMERLLLDDPRLGRIDVLKVAHHGSRTSTGEEFLNLTRPSFALISAGLLNTYRHPHPDVVARLAERRAAVLRTDEMGLITIRSDGRRFTLDTARWSGQRQQLESPF